jgi:hypothetical protein
MIYAAAAAALLGPGCASNHRTGERTEPGGGQNYGHLTGSYVPQDVQRNGPVTNGKSNVRVIDRSDIERSGGADINQTLRELGANR